MSANNGSIPPNAAESSQSIHVGLTNLMALLSQQAQAGLPQQPRQRQPQALPNFTLDHGLSLQSQGNQVSQMAQQVPRKATQQLTQNPDQLHLSAAATAATEQAQQTAQLPNQDVLAVVRRLLGSGDGSNAPPAHATAMETLQRPTTEIAVGITHPTRDFAPLNLATATLKATNPDAASMAPSSLAVYGGFNPGNIDTANNLSSNGQTDHQRTVPSERFELTDGTKGREQVDTSTRLRSLLENVHSGSANDVNATEQSGLMNMKSSATLPNAAASRTFPCRARGMPVDHNFKTAYFVVRETTQHGEDLVCSFEGCRNAGVKFRYCAHCKGPVGKRNFAKRHMHGMDEAEETHEEAMNSPDPNEFGRRAPNDNCASVESAGFQMPAQNPRAAEQIGALDNVAVPQNNEAGTNHGIDASTNAAPQQALGQSPVAAASEGFDAKSALAAFDHLLNPTDSRRIKWAALLDRRPANGDNKLMSSWMMEVLAVSDKSSSTTRNESASTTTACAAESATGSGNTPMAQGIAERPGRDFASTDTKKQAREIKTCSDSSKDWPAVTSNTLTSASARKKEGTSVNHFAKLSSSETGDTNNDSSSDTMPGTSITSGSMNAKTDGSSLTGSDTGEAGGSSTNDECCSDTKMPANEVVGRLASENISSGKSHSSSKHMSSTRSGIAKKKQRTRKN